MWEEDNGSGCPEGNPINSAEDSRFVRLHFHNGSPTSISCSLAFPVSLQKSRALFGTWVCNLQKLRISLDEFYASLSAICFS